MTPAQNAATAAAAGLDHVADVLREVHVLGRDGINDAAYDASQPMRTNGENAVQTRTTLDGPHRVQLRRAKGWRMPENTVSVARPGRWCNPFALGELKCFVNDDDPSDKIAVVPFTRAEAVAAFRWMATQSKHRAAIRELAGKNLACWCPLDQPCHADVLLELANAPA